MRAVGVQPGVRPGRGGNVQVCNSVPSRRDRQWRKDILTQTPLAVLRPASRLLAYGVLAGGTLSNKYANGDKPSGARHTDFPSE